MPGQWLRLLLQTWSEFLLTLFRAVCGHQGANAAAAAAAVSTCVITVVLLQGAFW